jgi:hypothetical protein
MSNTIYASFTDGSLAEKATGALLDHGVRAEDISVVRNHDAAGNLGEPISSNREYQPTGENQTWNAQTVDVDANRQGYVGSSYGANPSITDPQLSTNEYANVGYRASETTPPVVDDYNAAGTLPHERYENRESQEVRDPQDLERAGKSGISTTTGADAAEGAAKGLGWGAGIGVIAAVASLIVPGVGLVIGGGALATALGAWAATAGAGAIAGAVTGYLVDQGVDEHVAARYEDTIRTGGALLAVTVPSGNTSETEVRGILDKYGAANVGQFATRGYVA